MTTQTRKRTAQPSSCPPGYVPAGHIVPLSLTVRQQTYCRRAVGISRFVYNLCVATHQFCRTNRLPWPSWQNLNIGPAWPHRVGNALRREGTDRWSNQQ